MKSKNVQVNDNKVQFYWGMVKLTKLVHGRYSTLIFLELQEMEHVLVKTYNKNDSRNHFPS